MEKKTTVGPEGEVFIPKDILYQIGIKEYSEVIVGILGDSVVIRKLNPESFSYVDYYSATYSKKLTKKVNIKKITEESSMKGI